MQKLRPYAIPGLFVFHLVVMLSTVSGGNEAAEVVGTFTIVSQFFLTALFAGLGSGPWALRVPGWGSLATLSWLSFVFFAVKWSGAPRSDAAWRSPLVFLITWIVLVTLLLLLRVMPFLKWRIVSQTTLATFPPKKDSVTRGTLVVVATWGGVLMLLKDSWPWPKVATGFRQSPGALFSASGIATIVGAGALVVAMLAVGLTLTRLADWMFYRRRWTLPLSVILVIGAAVGLLLSFGGPFRSGSERLLAALWLLLGLATQPLATLLVMGMAGYRLAPRKPLELHAREPATKTPQTTTTERAENWVSRLQRVHFAAAIGLVLFFAGDIFTGVIDPHYLSVSTMAIRRNNAGETVTLRLESWATNKSLRAISNLDKLETLSLSRTNVTDAGLVHLKGLTELTYLGLNRTQITDAGLVHLKELTSLETLSLYNTQVTDAGLVHLKGLNLKELDIPEQAQTDTGLKHYLAAIEPPTRLYLKNWGITDAGIASLHGMNLRGLDIPYQAQTDTGLKHYLAAIELPNTLDLQRWQVTGAGLVHLKGMNLKELNIPFAAKTDLGLKHYLAAVDPSSELIRDWSITGAGLVHLKGLTHLQGLSIHGTKVTDAGLVHLKGLTKLTRLSLNSTKITGTGLVHLKGMTNLQKLSLAYNNQIADSELVHLRGLTNLQILGINGAKVTDAGLGHLKQMTNLRELRLYNTKVTGAGLVHLKGLPKLETLYFGSNRNQITDAALVHLKELANLKTLDLRDTKVTDAGVAELKQALPNCKIKK